MIKLNKVTSIQFINKPVPIAFDVWTTDYIANIVIDEQLVVQLSGNNEEAHVVSVPSGEECYYNNRSLQNKFYSDYDIEDIKDFLEAEGIENNAGFLCQF